MPESSEHQLWPRRYLHVPRAGIHAGRDASGDRGVVCFQEFGFGIGAGQRLAKDAGAVEVGDHNALLDQLLPYTGAVVMQQQAGLEEQRAAHRVVRDEVRM